MEIKPEIGIGELKFGMKPSDVKNLLGNPDYEKVEQDDENKLNLVYNTERLRLTFYESENNRLGYIITSNSNLTFNGIKIINSKIDYVKNEVFKIIIKKWEIEDYHSFISHFEEKYWLTLHSEFETVTNFEIGVPFGSDEDYKWPK